jgi:hypothetical protein
VRRHHCRVCGHHIDSREDHWPGCQNLSCERCHGDAVVELLKDGGLLGWVPCPMCMVRDEHGGPR